MTKDQPKKAQVVCCGNIAFDLIFNDKKSNNLSFSVKPGGSVLNTAILVSRLGLSVSLIAKTGNDFLGQKLLSLLKTENIKTDNVLLDSRLKTGLALAHLNKKGDPSYIFYKSHGKLTSFGKHEFPQNIFKNVSVFHTASAYSYDDFTFNNSLSFMQRSKKEKVFISYDPNWRENRIANTTTARNRIKKLLPYIDLLKLSSSDAMGITEKRTLSKALNCLPKNIIVTLGEKGAFFYDGKKKLHTPMLKVKTVDTIGAGDAFTAGLIYRYCLLGKKLFWEHQKENLQFASAASALICRGRGATEGLKNSRQVKRFLKTHLFSTSSLFCGK
ncbi:MAG: carbohydrate kinase [Candidatus Omnitrophica bacterium]|nr:carbohydrate kinase [Candidatus Omnitrophota bacterium]MBU1894337.1 carbohydrate kinase [Candidatus Omnitrophota bacterium]